MKDENVGERGLGNVNEDVGEEGEIGDSDGVCFAERPKCLSREREETIPVYRFPFSVDVAEVRIRTEARA